MLAISTDEKYYDLFADACRKTGLRAALYQVGGARRAGAHTGQGMFFETNADRDRSIEKLAQTQRLGGVLTTLSHDPLLTSELPLWNYCRELGVPYLGHSKVALDTFLDKHLTRMHAQSLGIDIARGGLVRNEDDLSDLVRASGGSFVVKSRDGLGGAGQIVVSRSCEFGDIEFGGDKLLAEEFLEGFELSILLFRYSDMNVALPAVLKGWTSRSGVHPLDRMRIVLPDISDRIAQKLMPICTSLTDGLDCRGWIEVEFVVLQGRAVLLEVNPRVAGTTRVASYASSICPFQISLDALLGRVSTRPVATNVALELPIVRPHALSDDGKRQALYAYRPGDGRQTWGRLAVAVDDPTGLSNALRGAGYTHREVAGSLKMFESYENEAQAFLAAASGGVQ